MTLIISYMAIIRIIIVNVVDYFLYRSFFTRLYNVNTCIQLIIMIKKNKKIKTIILAITHSL